MKEYEKGLRVNDILPFIDYCKSNGYKKVSQSKQNRMVFESIDNPKLIARVTIENENGKESIALDFKNFNKKTETSTIAEESKVLPLTKESLKIVLNMLQVMGFKQAANNYRIRHVYSNDRTKFEIDDYTSPLMKIVAIEGEERDVDSVYEDLKRKLQRYITLSDEN